MRQRGFLRSGRYRGGAHDLRPGADGRAWDFARPEDRAEAGRRTEQSPPYLLVGSPPRTDWCTLNVNLNHPRLGPAEVAERRRRARAHLSFVVKKPYLRQLVRGATSSMSTRQRRLHGMKPY